jgi:superfamily II DNA helicase RecQ
MEQEQTVYCLLEGRDVFSVMPTGIACHEVLE